MAEEIVSSDDIAYFYFVSEVESPSFA